MLSITENSSVKMVLSFEYSSNLTIHTDHVFCGEVNMWRDAFSKKHRELLLGCNTGDRIVLEERQELLPVEQKAKMIIGKKQWQPPPDFAEIDAPHIGRWYPQGFLRDIDGIFPQSRTPFRVIGRIADSLCIDCNHPLAGKRLSIRAAIEEVSHNPKERGGRCSDWVEEALSNGPGMQLSLENQNISYGNSLAFTRQVEDDDSLFYSSPRYVDHVDRLTRSKLMQHTKKLIHREMTILDLMSSVQSHLPERAMAIGLGMNRDEMQMNKKLSDFVVHNLNTEPFLPFQDGKFDCICCHLSFEYLLQPAKITAECARVLNANGLLIISISNRWFPEKVTRIWKMLHEFERLGYVLEHIKDHFSITETITYRNWPRPTDDPHYMKTSVSDPLFITVARKR